MMNWYRGDGYGWMDGGGMLVMSLIWIVIFGLGIWLVTRVVGKNGNGSSVVQETPRQILDRRYASGEIDADAYAQARRLIESKTPDVGESR